MRKRKSSSATPWGLDPDFKRALMQRDPLGKELTETLCRLALDARNQTEQLRLLRRRDELRGELSRKYYVPDLYIPDLSHLEKLRGTPNARERVAKIAWTPIGRRDSPIHIAGWAAEDVEWPPLIVKSRPPRFMRRRVRPPDAPPFLALTIDLSRVTGHDYERLVDHFISIVRQAKKELPAEHQQPDALRYLRGVSPDEFARDLSRYDLHMNEGSDYRQIAIRELAVAGQAGRGPSRRSLPSVERAVRSSVERVYRAIFRRPYIARRRRIEAAKGGPGEYACPEHGRDCPETCTTLKTWMRKVEPTLPAPNSGAESRALRRLRAEEHHTSSPPRPTPSRRTTPRPLTPRRRNTA